MMAIVMKYRVHEVAKDFKMNSKSIAEILTKYATAPKNHMQVLEEEELDIIFEYLTQKHQINSIEAVSYTHLCRKYLTVLSKLKALRCTLQYQSFHRAALPQ